ncbi:MAG: acyl-CoA thioesterase-1 [Saprospiraceae bacterium]|jgi:acyl-CoA thioesterase-1
MNSSLYNFQLKINILLPLLICLIPIIGCKDKPATKEVVVPIAEEKTNTPSTATKLQDNSRKKAILFFGDSLTAGYGLDEDESFPSLIQDRIDSLGLDYTVVNGGLSGETSAGGKGRIDWVLRSNIDVFVLELGANDVLRGLDLTETDKNLRAILNTVIAKHSGIPIVIAGMQAPPNMGKDYTDQFANIFTQLAKDYKASLIPFLLEGVAGDPSLNLADAKHPNAKGQYIVRDNVWDVLEEVL